MYIYTSMHYAVWEWLCIYVNIISYMGARCTFLAPPPLPPPWYGPPPPFLAPYPAVLAVTLEALLVLVLRSTINTYYYVVTYPHTYT